MRETSASLDEDVIVGVAQLLDRARQVRGIYEHDLCSSSYPVAAMERKLEACCQLYQRLGQRLADDGQQRGSPRVPGDAAGERVAEESLCRVVVEYDHSARRLAR